ncbi:MAG: HAD hydrolase-like protein [Pseudomonadota bacterium]
MSILTIPNARPNIVLFDWHATLVDTHDAMYHAVDDVLPKLLELNLIDRLVKTENSKTLEDAKLVKYVRENEKLHPKIKSERKISRTDIFQVLFGDDQEAKKIAHYAFDQAYRNYYGEVKPLEGGVEKMLQDLLELDLKVGVLTNRSREFMEKELTVSSFNLPFGILKTHFLFRNTSFYNWVRSSR